LYLPKPFAAALIEAALCRLITFHVPNLMSLVRCFLLQVYLTKLLGEFLPQRMLQDTPIPFFLYLMNIVGVVYNHYRKMRIVLFSIFSTFSVISSHLGIEGHRKAECV
jgi:hypothetical protein